VARLADDRTGVARAQQLEEAAGPSRVEGMRRRKLQQYHSQLAAQPGDFIEKPRQRLARPCQAAIVADHLRHLHREAEPGRHARGPPLIGRRRVRPVERRVDLRRVQLRGIALELRAF
jgi:hypothetical protein